MATQTRASLAADLRALGLAPGDTVWCHSSYSSLGSVEGGPQTVLDAFGDALGPEGLLVLPSFNLLEGGAENRMAHWDPATSPSTVGWLTEYARTAPDGLTHRSDHFSHAATARGKGAAECAPVPPSALRHHSQPERTHSPRGGGGPGSPATICCARAAARPGTQSRAGGGARTARAHR